MNMNLLYPCSTETAVEDDRSVTTGQVTRQRMYLSRNFLIIKPTRYTDFSNLFLELNSTYFGHFLCPSAGVFHCTHSNGICHTVLLTACSQAVSKTE